MIIFKMMLNYLISLEGHEAENAKITIVRAWIDAFKNTIFFCKANFILNNTLCKESNISNNIQFVPQTPLKSNGTPKVPPDSSVKWLIESDVTFVSEQVSRGQRWAGTVRRVRWAPALVLSRTDLCSWETSHRQTTAPTPAWLPTALESRWPPACCVWRVSSDSHSSRMSVHTSPGDREILARQRFGAKWTALCGLARFPTKSANSAGDLRVTYWYWHRLACLVEK